MPFGEPRRERETPNLSHGRRRSELITSTICGLRRGAREGKGAGGGGRDTRSGRGPPRQPARKVEASKKARAILQGELELARKQESELWKLIDKKAQLNTNNSLAAYEKMKAELVAGKNSPPPLRLSLPRSLPR